MIPECAWYCRDTYAINLRIDIQLIYNEMIFNMPHLHVHNSPLTTHTH